MIVPKWIMVITIYACGSFRFKERPWLRVAHLRRKQCIAGRQKEIYVPKVIIKKNINSIISVPILNPNFAAANNNSNRPNKNNDTDTIIYDTSQMNITHSKKHTHGKYENNPKLKHVGIKFNNNLFITKKLKYI